jgi:hypothetical protein
MLGARDVWPVGLYVMSFALDVTFYGLNKFRLNDPDGNMLWIGQNTGETK